MIQIVHFHFRHIIYYLEKSRGKYVIITRIIVPASVEENVNILTYYCIDGVKY